MPPAANQIYPLVPASFPLCPMPPMVIDPTMACCGDTDFCPLATYDTTQGFGLRAVAGEATGYAHASELSEAAIGRAAEAVSVVKLVCGTAFWVRVAADVDLDQ